MEQKQEKMPKKFHKIGESTWVQLKDNSPESTWVQLKDNSPERLEKFKAKMYEVTQNPIYKPQKTKE